MNRPLPQLRADLQQILRASVDAVEPGRLVLAALRRLPHRFNSPVDVLAAGKAAGAMFAAAAGTMPVRASVVSTTIGMTGAIPAGAHVFEGGHPAPTAASVAAGERALALAHESRRRTGLLVLLSGGASAMLAVPAPGITLEEKLQTARELMAAGASIDELNCVRKHLSRIKGGRIGAAAGHTVTLALSDVHGPIADDPSVIGSGLTVPDPTTFADALGVLQARCAAVPPPVRAHLERGARGEVEESVKPGDPRIRESTYMVVGNRVTAMDGASRAAEALGYRVIVLGPATHGEARTSGRIFVEIARLEARGNGPVCVIASGETTVTVRGDGRGGRNQEFALAAAAPLAGGDGPAVVASAGTDGIDGPTDAAGAVTDSTTLTRAARLGLRAEDALARNDAYRFFAPLGDLIIWGPTGTNVGDVHVMLIG